MRKITDLGPLCTEKHHYEEAQKYTISFMKCAKSSICVCIMCSKLPN